MAAAAPKARPPVKVELRGEILFVTLDRPEKRNALNLDAVTALETIFAEPPAAARVAILSGEGEHFSAGLDLAELGERDIIAGIDHSMIWHRAFERIEFGRVPVISVLKGAVIGGGLELAAATHIRVAEQSAYYGLPEGRRGIFVGGGGSVRLPRLFGAARMADMMLTGRIYDAEDGYRLGLSQYLVEPGAGLEKAEDLARTVAGNSDLTNFAVIHALPRIGEAGSNAGYLMESLMSAIAQDAGEAKSRLRDFLEKRAAKVKPDERS
jgi:enoyl-CoA hydratase/carnithine racemase